MKICVLDLEMNKPSNSIIEIGAVCLDAKTGKITNSFSTLVDPQEPLDPFIVQLTTITQADLAHQPKIKEALNNFNEWMTSVGCHKMVSAWGSDWHLVLNQFKQHGIHFEHPKHLDIKVMASVLRCAFPNTKSKGGLANTMALFDIPFEGQQHQALVDASNTARLLFKFVTIVQKFNEISDIVGEI